ncbi:MAG: methyltransferase domain-containing protein [Herpetosiphonaceae bacterium]|nr:methyltransferase domain-containing protein [Herpetosiphonaceae bacterium]
MTVTPDPIMQLLSGVLAAKYLMVGTETGLFEQLSAEPATLEQLAERLAMPQRTVRMLADALTAIQLLVCHDGHYSNSPVSAAFLSGHPGPDLRPVVRLWNNVVYPQWLDLERSLRTNSSTLGFADFDHEQQLAFSIGVEALTIPSARALATIYDWSKHERLLDLGGGTGSFIRTITSHFPDLCGTMYELPATIEVVRERQATQPVQFELLAGNFLSDELPEGFDAVLLANVVHLFSLEHNGALFRRIRQVVPDHGRLLLVDFWTDPTHTQPAFAALMAAEFQIVTGEGDVYSVPEMKALLAGSGWNLVGHHHLAGAASLIVAEPAL